MAKVKSLPTVFDLLVERARLDGGTPFLFPGRADPLSASALLETAKRIGAGMVDAGVQPGDWVMLFIGRGAEGLAALFGAWSVGALVAPVDPFMSGRFIEACHSLLTPALCLVDQDLPAATAISNTVLRCGTPVLSPRALGDYTPAGGCAPPPPDEPALCIFTSGSTGTPKGVVHSLRTVTEAAWNQARAQCLTPQDRGVGVLPLSHVHGLVFPVLGPLVSGGQTALYPDSFQAAPFLGYLSTVTATWFTTIPMHYKLMVDEGEALVGLIPPSVTFCRSASAPLDPDVWARFEALHGIPLINTLGMSETAGQIFAVPRDRAGRSHTTIGRPHGFEVQVRPLTDTASEADGSTSGEANVRGPAMMLGYLALGGTLESPLDPEGWLSTGDVMSIDAEGDWRVVGRVKDIAIFGGVNISLAEIETLLEGTDGVHACTCLRRPHPTLGELIRICVEAEPERMTEAFGHALLSVAETGVPIRGAIESLVFMECLPRSGAGKKLRGPALEQAPAGLSVGFNINESPEAVLARILELPPEAVSDDLSAETCAAWDSLAQVNLLLEAEDRLRRRLTPGEVADLRSVEGFRRVLAGQTDTNPASAPLVQSATTAAIGRMMALLEPAGYGTAKINLVMMSYGTLAAWGAAHPEPVIEALITALSPGAHLMMNTFTWSFCRGTPFDVLGTPCEVGLLNELLRRRPGVVRSPNPIYSYAVFGPDAAEIARDDGMTCWGEGSVTHRIGTSDDTLAFTLGLGPLPGQAPSLIRANATLHSLEERYAVSYRYHKTFRGMCRLAPDQTWTVWSTTMFVRPLDRPVRNDWRAIFNPLLTFDDTNYDEAQQFLSYRTRTLIDIAESLIASDPTAFLASDEPGSYA